MSPKGLRSKQFEVVDIERAIGFYYTKGWTDGLPVIPPTEKGIWAMLDAAGLEPEAEITFIEHR